MASEGSKIAMKSLKTLVYYFPNYHADPRNEAVHGKGWTEWELMKHATPRFPGHDQPKVPLWGYEDEADPAVMSRKIDAAASHGVDAFVFDWYWYEGPFLQRALDEGFLGCGNAKLQFALMWANHDWDNFHPATRTRPYPVDFYWTTTFDTVGFVWDYLIERYFTRPGYLKVDGKPYFSIYGTNRFIIRMGGVERCARAVALLQEKARQAGLPGIHLNGMWWDNMDSDPASICPQSDWVNKIGFDSYSSYNIPLYTFPPELFPRADYDQSYEIYYAMRERAIKHLPGPYFPVITMGWDSSPRTVQSEVYERQGYPYYSIMEPTPEKFGAKVAEALALLAKRPENERLLFINAWNEWTEGSYLEPDTKHGYGFLEALKRELDVVAEPVMAECCR